MSLNFAPFTLDGRRTVLLAPGDFSTFGAKTAVCYLRYRQSDVAAVIDPVQSGRTVAEVVGFGGDIPILADIDAVADAELAIVGVAPQGGRLSEALFPYVMRCVEAGLDVVSGLHDFLNDDERIGKAAEKSGSRLWDVRAVPTDQKVSTGLGCQSGAHVVLLVGTDCNVGKMTATVELYNEACARGIDAAWAATGQTGMMLRGRGIAIDRVIADFIGGAAEELVAYEAKGRNLLFVEGQGALVHPGYAGVMLGLMYGVMPDCMVLVHAPSRHRIGDSPFEMPPVRDLIRLYEMAMEPLKRSPVVAIALNTSGFESAVARDIIQRTARDTGLPVSDAVRFGSRELVDAVLNAR